MITDLTDTTTAAIALALDRARRAAGSPSLGMVLTLVVVADESTHYDAVRAANDAAREHPSRILGLVTRGGRGAARLDAEVQVGGDLGPGETVVMRLHGELSRHAEAVVTPLLLPDAPVVVWWPGSAPRHPGEHPLGALATRRVTDAAAQPRPLAALRQRAVSYLPGDTDLAWTRLTPWRTLLAAALDQAVDPVTGAVVAAQRANPSAELLAVWLQQALRVPVERRTSRGPGITGVTLHLRGGDVTVSRPDGRLARLSRPGQPDRTVALPRRSLPELLAEELRRLDPDEVYAETVAGVPAATAPAAATAATPAAAATAPPSPAAPARPRSSRRKDPP